MKYLHDMKELDVVKTSGKDMWTFWKFWSKDITVLIRALQVELIFSSHLLNWRNDPGLVMSTMEITYIPASAYTSGSLRTCLSNTPVTWDGGWQQQLRLCVCVCDRNRSAWLMDVVTDSYLQVRRNQGWVRTSWVFSMNLWTSHPLLMQQ